MLDMDVIDVSSTEVRSAIRNGESTPLLPVQVRQYALSAGLYGRETPLPHGSDWLQKGDTVVVVTTANRVIVELGDIFAD